MNDRVISTSATREDDIAEASIRPKKLDEYLGQEDVREQMKIFIEASKRRGDSLDHVLIFGPPGLGKTTLSHVIANEMGVNIRSTSGPVIERAGDLAALLTNLQPHDVLFIDEIHRMNVSVEEILYSAMEDYRLDIVIGQGPSARTMQIQVAPFTLIGATTRSGLLSNPLRDRFMAHLHFDFYNHHELSVIVENNSKKLNITLDKAALYLIAACARGTPRIANRILRRVRDFALVKGENQISEESVKKSLSLMEIDSYGLDRMDRKILQVIEDYYKGGPVGIETLCATLAEDRTTIEDVYEPYLLKEGFLLRTPRGREISQKSKDHLIKMKSDLM